MHRYVDTLLDCNKLLDESWLTVCISDNTLQTLSTNNLYPLREKLKELLKIHGIHNYDSNTVATIVHKLLDRSQSFETRYRVKDVLFKELKTDPNIIQQVPHDGLRYDLKRCVAFIAVLRKYCQQPLGGHLFMIRKALGQLVKVRTQIEIFEHERNEITSLPPPPEIFEGTVLTCDDFQGLIECIDEKAMLVGAPDDSGIKLSIRVALFKYASGKGEKLCWGETSPLAIGKEFRKLCQRCCKNRGPSMPSKILRSVIKIKRGDRTEVHPLRKGEAMGYSQQTRGNDKAQRCKIDDELRLHFWDCADGTIELASVTSYHDDFSIPE